MALHEISILNDVSHPHILHLEAAFEINSKRFFELQRVLVIGAIMTLCRTTLDAVMLKLIENVRTLRYSAAST